MIDASKLRGPGVKARETLSIIAKAHRALWVGDCPYSRNTHKWSIWMTAYRNPDAQNIEVFHALLKAGVKCDE